MFISKTKKQITFDKIFFQKISSTKQNYDIHDKKLLIIVVTLKY